MSLIEIQLDLVVVDLTDAEVYGDAYHTIYIPFCWDKFSQSDLTLNS